MWFICHLDELQRTKTKKVARQIFDQVNRFRKTFLCASIRCQFENHRLWGLWTGSPNRINGNKSNDLKAVMSSQGSRLAQIQVGGSDSRLNDRNKLSLQNYSNQCEISLVSISCESCLIAPISQPIYSSNSFWQSSLRRAREEKKVFAFWHQSIHQLVIIASDRSSQQRRSERETPTSNPIWLQKHESNGKPFELRV